MKKITKPQVNEEKLADRKKSEVLTDQIRQNYDTFFNTINDFLFVLDLEGKIIKVNDTVIKRLGYSEKELIGKSVLFIHPHKRRAEAGRIVEEILSGKTDFCPVPIEAKSGLKIPVETRVTTGIWDGQPALFGVSKDISEAKLSEEKFSKTFQMNPSACGITNLVTGQYVEVNQAFCDLLGFDMAEVLGKNATELGIISSDERKRFNSKIGKDNKVANFEAWLRTKNGDIKQVLLSADNIYVQDKIYRITVVSDITGRQAAEENLRVSEEKYRTTVSALPDMLFYFNAKGVFLDCVSSRFGTLLVPKEAFIGKTLQMVMPPTIAKQGMSAIAKVLKNHDLEAFEYSLEMPEGEQYFEIRLVESAPNEVLGIARNITEQKKAELLLKLSEEKYRLLVNNSHDIIYKLTKDGIFEYVSPTWTILLGHPINQVEGKSFQDFIDPNDIPACLAWLQKLTKSGKRQAGIEYRVRHLDGRWFWHTSKAVPIKDKAGKVTGYYGIASDITEQKRLEERLLKLALRDSLTGLYSRHYYEEEVLRIKSGRHFPVSVIYIDIDGLNEVNNTLGHSEGDKLLIRASAVIGSDFRTEDNISRIGGDEFIVLLSETNEETVINIVDRIKMSLAQHNLEYPHSPLSFSIGQATALENNQLDKAIRLADKRMYVEKRKKKRPKDN